MVEDDLTAVAREIRERVRARYPDGAVGPVPLPDVMPLWRARDAAMAKVAAIGTVNPRPPGAVNALIQTGKRLVARALRWFVRDQVEFNRGVMACVEATLEALNDCKRSFSALAGEVQRIQAAQKGLEESQDHLRREVKDVCAHWVQWRQEWERKLSVNEVQFLRSVADLQGAFQHRTSLMESGFRELVASQHKDFSVALERATLDIQKRLWEDLARIREEYERLIHYELRVVRQRVQALGAGDLGATASPLPKAFGHANFDSLKFADRFRGTPEAVKENQKFYLPYFQNAGEVLDIGCGRGEFLSLLRDAGIPARGIDSSEECVRLCVAQGLEALKADLFEYLDGLPDASLDGVFCAQVVEHLEMGSLPVFVNLLAAKLRRGGVVVIETPNPECLAIFATHFYLDPTHIRPAPAPLLVFLLEEAGFGGIQVERRFPAAATAPALLELPEGFRNQFFGAQDYAVIARRL